MPQLPQNKLHQHRGASRAFVSSEPPSDTVETESESDGGILWESETESETEADVGHSECWESQPKPWTYDEKELRRLEKQEKAAAKHRTAEMCSAENREGGALNNDKEILVAVRAVELSVMSQGLSRAKGKGKKTA
ncbi:hypothetical protein C8R45DRAFT_936528 [Mycena sanguinolenta]|nr:hypothetical protein C8R45DRAFT_936528 [Mycena sanguinolenta]